MRKADVWMNCLASGELPGGKRATLLHLYRGNNRVSFGRSELKNHHAILGIHFEMLLIRGQRTSRGGCHIQIGQNLLPIRENIENAVAGMERRLHKREDYAMRTVSRPEHDR